MKKLLLIYLFTWVAINLAAQKENILFPSNLTTVSIDTSSINREMDRVYVTVSQEPYNNTVIKEEFTKLFSQKYLDGKPILKAIRLKVRLGCDCEINDLIIIDNKPQWLGLDSLSYSFITINDGMRWSKSSVPRRKFELNDTEFKLINDLCSKYTYKTDTIVQNLFIEEIPRLSEINTKFYLEGMYREKFECNLPYYSFTKFNNDTTAFLRYNFKDRAICYRGKTVAQVLADLQLTPRSYTPSPSIYTGKYAGVRIHVDNTTTNERLQNSKRKTQYIYIYWKELLDNKGVVELLRKYDDDIWIQEHYDFFKDNIVGEVSTK